MTSALLALALSCSPHVPDTEDITSPNGRFTLHVTPRELALKEQGAPSPRWTVRARRSLNRYVVSDTGAWVAVVDESSAPWVTLYDAKGKATTPPLAEALDEEEAQHLPFSSCGSRWLAGLSLKGDVLKFTVDVGGNRRPTEPAGPRLRVTLNALRGTVSRSAKVSWPSISELVEAAEAGQGEGPFDALVLKAKLQSSQGDPDLCDYFARYLRTRQPMRGRAVQALEAAHCERQLAAIDTSPRGDVSDHATLDALAAGEAAAADQFALDVLRQRRLPLSLRIDAVRRLVHEDVYEPWEAARLGLEDPEERVRVECARQVASLPRSSLAFELLLEAAGRTGAEAGPARRKVLEYLETPDYLSWPDKLTEAVNAGRLEQWPAVLVVLGGLEEAKGSGATGASYYRRALEKLDPQRPSKGPPFFWADGELWCEAKLRLAQQAAAAGDAALAVKLAKDVLAWGGHVTVAAPDVNRFAGGAPVFQAYTVAQDIVRSRGLPPKKKKWE